MVFIMRVNLKGKSRLEQRFFLYDIASFYDITDAQRWRIRTSLLRSTYVVHNFCSLEGGGGWG